MKIPLALLAAAALGLTGCDPYPPPPPPPLPGAPAAMAYGSSMVTIGNKAPFGTFLVDGAGRSLYILEGTRGTAGARCSGACLRAWPPLHVSGPPVAGANVDRGRLSTVIAHGAPHITYDGWPLYYYHHDRAPGDTTGQHVTDAWGTWHLIAPSGVPIRPAASRY